jgi:hypothetical protein
LDAGSISQTEEYIVTTLLEIPKETALVKQK